MNFFLDRVIPERFQRVILMKTPSHEVHDPKPCSRARKQ